MAVTVITEVDVDSGQEAVWDDAFHERFDDAPNQPGWVSVQLLVPQDAPTHRVVVGTWESRSDWERWHTTDVFQRTREQMDRVSRHDGEERWYEVASMETAG
jgi:heme-degrading monooxygenase HmoA